MSQENEEDRNEALRQASLRDPDRYVVLQGRAAYPNEQYQDGWYIGLPNGSYLDHEKKEQRRQLMVGLSWQHRESAEDLCWLLNHAREQRQAKEKADGAVGNLLQVRQDD